MERWAAAPPNYPQRQLPIPELNRADPATGCPFLFQAGGRQLCERYVAARVALGHGPSPP